MKLILGLRRAWCREARGNRVLPSRSSPPLTPGSKSAAAKSVPDEDYRGPAYRQIHDRYDCADCRSHQQRQELMTMIKEYRTISGGCRPSDAGEKVWRASPMTSWVRSSCQAANAAGARCWKLTGLTRWCSCLKAPPVSTWQEQGALPGSSHAAGRFRGYAGPCIRRHGQSHRRRPGHSPRRLYGHQRSAHEPRSPELSLRVHSDRRFCH